jgi:hypothetical protein
MAPTILAIMVERNETNATEPWHEEAYVEDIRNLPSNDDDQVIE